jgi:hypothetical protein
MKQPHYLLDSRTRIRTHAVLGDTMGFLITERHLSQRKPNAVGAISGIVGGHGGDVYFVTHVGDSAMAVYSFDEFELEPAADPICQECLGSGIDFPASHTSKVGTACGVCGGSGSAPPRPRPTSWDHLSDEET